MTKGKLNFLEKKEWIEDYVHYMDRLGDKWGASNIGDLLLVKMTEDEIHLNYAPDIQSGESVPSIIITSGHRNGNYPVTILYAASDDIDATCGYIELTEPRCIPPCKTLKEALRGVAEFIFQ